MAQVYPTTAWLVQPAGCRMGLLEHPGPHLPVEVPQLPQLFQPAVLWMAQIPLGLGPELILIL